ncbi:MAG: FKBP-type peptidyl-prolyl cis-trans isomerase [Pyrinomonadaceae bacterium]
MPQSRQRKTNKTRKRPKGLYPATKSKPPTGSNSTARTIAIVIVLALAASVIAYVIVNRKGKGGDEITTASGLKYTDLVVGAGATPQKGQTVTVHYTGTLENGKKFDSSLDRGTPADFRIGVGAVIKGWDEGLMSMKVGGQRHLVIPAKLGYGPNGRPPDIPGNSTLVFDVELLGVK